MCAKKKFIITHIKRCLYNLANTSRSIIGFVRFVIVKEALYQAVNAEYAGVRATEFRTL